VVPDAEGGLLGLATLNDKWIYAYITATDDNRIIRMPLSGSPGSYSFGAPELIASGMHKARSHDGGRIKFGPDGNLYATVGDARQSGDAQDPASLNGKILRMTPEGNVPYDNPFPNSLVYSMGHRNPQGITWDDTGQLWAAEFGQNTWDELNRIEAGGNYGWPVVEGIGGNPAYIDPVQQWDTDDASPSGLVFSHGTFFLAALRGQRIWMIHMDGTTVHSEPAFVGTFGRIRDVVEGPDDTIWFVTSNTWNGVPRVEDDKLYEVRLVPLAGG
jgi:glucose/arabinose dehydrogenase